MPMWEYDGLTAARNLQANPASRWYKAGARANDRKGALAFQRLGKRMFVPLMATFTMRDVVIANTLSKSMLRVAAEEWAMSQPNVHYFPSYEVVMNSLLRRAWEDDRRHVTGKIAKHIIGLLIKHYVRQ